MNATKLVQSLAIASFLGSSSTAASGQVAPAATPTVPFRAAELDDHLDVLGEAIAASRAASRMYVNVSLNGAGPFQFVVDSGADRTVVGTAVAEKLSLPEGEPVTISSIAGRKLVKTAQIERLQIGTSIIHSISAPALPEQFLDAQGILGIDALADQRLMLDFEHNTITVQDSHTPVHSLAGEIVVTAHRRHGQLLLTQVRVDGVSLYAIIDTGSDITLGNRALLMRLKHTTRNNDAHPILITSVTGQSVVAEGHEIRDLHIGPLSIDTLDVAFADVRPFEMFGLAKQPALLLGTDALRAFKKVSLDFERRKVRFQLNPGSTRDMRDCDPDGVIIFPRKTRCR